MFSNTLGDTLSGEQLAVSNFIYNKVVQDLQVALGSLGHFVSKRRWPKHKKSTPIYQAALRVFHSPSAYLDKNCLHDRIHRKDFPQLKWTYSEVWT